jgi:hypothetical protein
MGTTVPGLTLAKGSIIDTLYLNPLTELKLNKLYNLDEDAVDKNGIKKFQYDNYEGYKLFDSLTDVSIQDCPGLNKFSYNLAKNNKIKNYCFNDIHWNIPVEHWVSKSVWEPNVEDSLEQQEEKLKKSVSVLHNLLDNSKGFVGVDKRSLALTGDITINVPEGE